MSNKKLLVYWLNNLCTGGTEKNCLLLCKYLRKIQEVNGNYIICLMHLAYNDQSRKQQFIDVLGENKIITTGSLPEAVYILKELNPHFVHMLNAGVAEHPMSKSFRPYFKYAIQTSVFGNTNDQIEPDATIYVSNFNQHLANKFGSKYHVINNPVEAKCSDKNLREKLNIGKDIFVFGHIGRFDASTYCNINLEAYAKIESDKTHFIWLPNNELVRQDVERLKIKNYTLLEKIFDPIELSKFYNTIDVKQRQLWITQERKTKSEKCKIIENKL